MTSPIFVPKNGRCLTKLKLKMSKHCVISLSNPTTGETRQIKWKLRTNSVVDRWVGLINLANANTPAIQYTTWGMYDDTSKMPELVASINESITWFNINNGRGYTIEPVTEVNRAVLNHRHAEFEKYALMFLNVNLLSDDVIAPTETCSDGTAMSYHLGNINQTVHALEKLIEINPRYVCASFSTYVMNAKNKPHEIPLAPEDYALFTLGYDFGDLMLGYATTGKSLFHLYKDGNIDLLEKGGHASPQRVIATNLLAMFYEGTLDKYEREPFYAWFDSNKLDKYGYNKDDPKNAIGNIILGSLVRDPITASMTKREFIRYHTDFSTINSVVIV